MVERKSQSVTGRLLRSSRFFFPLKLRPMPYKRLSIAWCSCKRKDRSRESPFGVKVGTTLENAVGLLRKQNADRADLGLSEYLPQREPIFWGKDDRRWSWFLVKGGLTDTATPPTIISVAGIFIYLHSTTVRASPGFLSMAVRTVIFTLAAIITIIGFRSHATINT